MKYFYVFLFALVFTLNFSWGITQKTFAQSLISEMSVVVDDVVVTATRTEVPLKKAASSVTVIDEKRIQEKHLSTVLEVLREVPGLDIVQPKEHDELLQGFAKVYRKILDLMRNAVYLDGNA